MLMWLLLTCLGLTGCGEHATSLLPSSYARLEGSTHGGQQPLTGALVQLYTAGLSGNASPATPLVTQPVYTDANGNFSLTGLYTCPSPEAFVYLVARGGNPGLSAGTHNAAAALLAALGPCGALTDATFVEMNEVTTAGSIWPLASFAAGFSEIGYSSAGGPSFNEASANIANLVNIGTGEAQGPLLSDGSIAPTAKLNALANLLAACINSSGGTSGDGTICGDLFGYASSASFTPANTVDAAIAIAQDPTHDVLPLFGLIPSISVFQPTLTSAPADWTLPIYTPPVAPVITPASGTYATGQQVTITENSGNSPVYYTIDGSAPSASSLPYVGPFSLMSSETVRAIALNGPFSSAISSATFALAPGVSVSVAPSSVLLMAENSQTFTATVTGSSQTGIVWSLSPNVGSISNAGLYTAPAVVTSAQDVTISATSVADSTKVGSVTVSLAPSTAGYTTYFVDNVVGSDSNSGTSPSAPLATIAKVNSLHLTAGETVVFKAGDAWHEQLMVSRSGASTLPITYTSYGDGPQPVIDASDTATGWRQDGARVWSRTQGTNPLLINFGGQTGVVVGSVAALTATDTYFWDGARLHVYSLTNPSGTVEIPARLNALSSAGASQITISGLEFRGGTTTVFCGVANSCSYWDFENDTFDNAYSVLLGWQFNTGVASVGLKVNNSTFWGAGSAGIGIGNGGTAMGALITNNTMSNLCMIYVANSSANAYCDAINLFSQTGTDGGGYIGYNNIQNVGLISGAAYGGGIHPDTVVDWDIEHNTVMNTNYPGIEIEKGSGSIAQYNLLVNTGTYPYFSGLMIRAGEGLSTQDQDVEFNTVYGGWFACSLGITQDSGAVTATSITMSKNICDGAASGIEFYADPGFDATSNTFFSNSFAVAANNFVVAGSSFCSSYSCLPAAISGSIPGDPEFINPASSNFQLQSSSPDAAIGAFPLP